MGYTIKENYRPIVPCEECPAFSGMNNIAVSRTPNAPMPEGEWVLAANYPDKVFYAHDPDARLAGNVILGEDIGCSDALCGMHEYASSRVLGHTHEACSNCTGPKDVYVGFIRSRKKTVCGAGFEKDRGTVSRLIRFAKRQGRTALVSSDIVLASSPRQ